MIGIKLLGFFILRDFRENIEQQGHIWQLKESLEFSSLNVAEEEE